MGIVQTVLIKLKNSVQQQILATQEQPDLTITFNPVHVQFSYGGQFTVDLSEPVFMTYETKNITAKVTLDIAPTTSGGGNGIDPAPPISTPEPSTFLLLGAGLLGFGLVRRMKK